MSSNAVGTQFWNREELYQDVWNQPLTALMSKYGFLHFLPIATAWPRLLGQESARPNG